MRPIEQHIAVANNRKAFTDTPKYSSLVGLFHIN